MAENRKDAKAPFAFLATYASRLSAQGKAQHLPLSQALNEFSEPREISFSCTCPDSASMCKHIAATFYGVGARLDQRPELLFSLRRVDAKDLVRASAGKVDALRLSTLHSFF